MANWNYDYTTFICHVKDAELVLRTVGMFMGSASYDGLWSEEVGGKTFNDYSSVFSNGEAPDYFIEGDRFSMSVMLTSRWGMQYSSYSNLSKLLKGVIIAVGAEESSNRESAAFFHGNDFSIERYWSSDLDDTDDLWPEELESYVMPLDGLMSLESYIVMDKELQWDTLRNDRYVRTSVRKAITRSYKLSRDAYAKMVEAAKEINLDEMDHYDFRESQEIGHLDSVVIANGIVGAADFNYREAINSLVNIVADNLARYICNYVDAYYRMPTEVCMATVLLPGNPSYNVEVHIGRSEPEPMSEEQVAKLTEILDRLDGLVKEKEGLYHDNIEDLRSELARSSQAVP